MSMCLNSAISKDNLFSHHLLVHPKMLFLAQSLLILEVNIYTDLAQMLICKLLTAIDRGLDCETRPPNYSPEVEGSLPNNPQNCPPKKTHSLTKNR